MSQTVVTSVLLYFVVNRVRRPYYAHLLYRGKISKMDRCCYKLTSACVFIASCLHLERKSEVAKVRLEKKLRRQRRSAPSGEEGSDARIHLEEGEEAIFIETIVSAAPPNIWAILMPALYCSCSQHHKHHEHAGDASGALYVRV
jgi:hypothetical protein